jgi:dTDP-4-dehydrorhamnose reductase
MKIFLTGKNGQVGFELNKKLSTLGDVIATDRNELDLSDPNKIRAYVDQVKPDIIINAAAYTAVDKAESEPELAYQINVIAPKVLAEKAAELKARFTLNTTNSVFKADAQQDNIPIDGLHIFL